MEVEGASARLLRRLAVVAASKDQAAADQVELDMIRLAMRELMQGGVPDVTVAALLTALESHGASERPEWIRALADTMLEFSVPLQLDLPADTVVVDVVGTGGDGKDAFNVSTAAGIIMAACGVTVAKHGNRSSSGAVGSADFLEALGAQVYLDADATRTVLERTQFGFLFAQQFHPAMKHVAPVRKQLGFRTVFNLLGPLTNPVAPDRVVIGVSRKSHGPVFAELLRARGVAHALVVHSHDGLDEISPASPTWVWEVRAGSDVIQHYDISPATFGLQPHNLVEVCDLDLETRAATYRSVLSDEPSAVRDFIIANAAAGLYVAGQAASLKLCAQLAVGVLEDGRARAKLHEYVQATLDAMATRKDSVPLAFAARDMAQDPIDTRQFQTRGGIEVTRITTPLTDVEAAITDLSQDLDANLGCMVLSDYEQPGRYHKWMKGFRNPPLMLTSREYAFQLTALNDRGQILLPAIRRELEQTQYIDNLTVESDFLQGRVARPDRRFLEEERSRQPSIFTVVRAIANAFHSPADAVLGLYGAFGYDLTFQFEPTKLRMTRPAHQRDIVLYIPDEVVVWDPREDLAFVYSYDFAWDGKSTQGLPRTGPKTVVQYADELERSQDHEPGQYATKVAKAKEKFKRGDLFECVLSQSFYSLLPCPPSELFRRLRKGNPAPFTFIMNLGSNEYLVGGSPEMYVRVQGDEVETCPISGTIRRGRDPVEDAKQILTLLADPKEESELTMCTDVDRNDKSRICEAGSVKVVGRRQIEMYSRLIHTVDHVKGKLREGFDALDAFLCHTWAVTVTGAPKPWAIQFVEDMEESPRGWYAGAVGALHFDGSLNTGLTLRTIQIHNGVASVRAGATLLYDSEPDKEEQETRLKASAFLDVLRVAPEDMSEALSAYQGEQRRAGAGLRVVVIDHQDSFVHTLANYLRQTGAEVMTLRTGFQPAELQALHPDMALLSPGPGCPADFNVSGEIALLMRLCIPTFGVCLGLQGMVEHFGGRLDVLQYPLHGKPTAIDVVEPRSYIFKDLPRRFTVARYHSLYARVEDVPTKNFKVTAVSEDGVVMAIEHRTLPLAAVQFHPESILTDHVHGLSMLQNVLHEFTSRGKAGFQRRKTVI